MRNITAAATQMTCSRDRQENILKAESLIRKAARHGQGRHRKRLPRPGEKLQRPQWEPA